MENQGTYNFCPIHSYGDQLEEYKTLHNLLFRGALVSREWINWYHNTIGTLDDRLTGTRTYGVYDSEKLIGIWSVEPKLVCIENDKFIKTGRCFAVGIHSDYRRQGLFVSLSKYALEQERKHGEYEYILGFPQTGRTVIGGHLQAGWVTIQDIDIYSYCPVPGETVFSRSKAETITDFKSIYFPGPYSGSFCLDAEYLNHRWIKHPDLQYIYLTYKNAFIVLKPYSNFCHVVDFAGDADHVSVLLEVSKSLATRHGWVELNIWCAFNEIFKAQIMKAGFKKGANFGSPISMIGVQINAKEALTFETCHFQMGVEEGY